MTVLDKFSLLDPARAKQQIETAHEGAVLDNFGLLDPARAARQLESELDIVVDNFAVLDSKRLATLIEAAFSGGSMNWVPDNAKVHIDLVENRAWTETDGEVAINTLLGNDPIADGVGYGNTGYSEDDLTGYGLLSSLAPALIGEALTRALSDATIVIRTNARYGSGNITFTLAAEEGAREVECVLGTDGNVYLSSEEIDATIESIVNSGEGAINCMAMTRTSERAEVAVNGSDPLAEVLTAPELEGIVASLINLSGAGGQTLQSITIYDALPSTAGLSELSETGGTNTGPYNMTFFNNMDDPDGASGTMEDSEFGAVTGAQVVLEINATDDEGNPLTVSISDDPSDAVILWNSDASETAETLPAGTSTGVVLTKDLHVADSPVTFTIRATDLGGLYVEQEFTITVGASTVITVVAGDDVTLSYDGDGYTEITIEENELLESVTFTAMTTSGLLSIQGNPILTAIDLDDLETVSDAFLIQNNDAVVDLAFPNLTTVADNIGMSSSSLLESVAFPALTSIGGNLNMAADPALTEVTFGALLSIGGNVSFGSSGLPEAQVDAILAMLVDLDGTGGTTLFENATVNLSGGTNAIPSAAGLTAKTTLEGRGCTVMVNE